MILKLGSKGPDVAKLQADLTKLGYSPGAADGIYGDKTRLAVLAFQLDYSDVDDDGIAGPQTQAKIASVLAQVADPPAAAVPCNAVTWDAFQKLVDIVTRHPIRYGPGRGLWSAGRFVITHGPGALNSKNWTNFLGHSYASFHCSSWTNFFLGWLLRYNELYTHSGNIPDLITELLVKDKSLHQQPDSSPYRGYGEYCSKIVPDGSGYQRHKSCGDSRVVDARELLARAATGELPTFVVCGQSTKQSSGKYKWWHHTVLFVCWQGRLFRIAADGYRDATKGYSAQPMQYVEVTAANVAAYDAAIYIAFGVNTIDGSYGDQTKPIASVEIEA